MRLAPFGVDYLFVPAAASGGAQLAKKLYLRVLHTMQGVQIPEEIQQARYARDCCTAGHAGSCAAAATELPRMLECSPCDLTHAETSGEHFS